MRRASSPASASRCRWPARGRVPKAGGHGGARPGGGKGRGGLAGSDEPGHPGGHLGRRSRTCADSPGARGPQSPRSALDLILKKERHVSGAGWVSDAIYGVNDGLGAVFGIVSGMAGYTGGSEIVLITGLAGTLASALSMGSSAYLAAKSQREVYQGEIAREKAEIEHNPEEEREELELYYQLKGFTEEEARTLVARIREQPEDFLKTLVQEELGLSEATFPNPWKACLSATASTAVGGIIPVIPSSSPRERPPSCGRPP